VAESNGQTAVASELSQQEFIDNAVRAFAANPENRDLAIAQILYMTTVLHNQMLGAFAAIQSGGLGGLKDILGGVLLGKGRK